MLPTGAPAPRMLPAGVVAAVVTVPRTVSLTYLVFQVEVRAALRAPSLATHGGAQRL